MIGLLERAIRVPNESLGSLENADSFAPSLARLVANADKPRKQVRGSGRSRRIWQTLVGLAMLFGAVWLGIVLVLETQKGQVVIETDVSNLQVELLASGEVKQKIELVPGENTTRVYAGEYEIRINDGSDRYVIDQNSFVLKRGEKVVARITVSPNDKRAAITWSNRQSTSPANATAVTKSDSQTGQVSDSDSPDGMSPLDFLDPPELHVYSVTGDAEQYQRILSTLFEGESKVRIEAESAGRKLIVWARGSVHVMISETLQKLDGAPPANPISDAQPTLNQPVFEGRTADEWLNVLEFEANGTLVHQAKDAIAALSRGHLETKERVDQFLMKHIMTGQEADWIEGAVATFGLSDASLDQIESVLPGKDNEVSRWLFQILFAIAATYQSETDLDARLNRIRSSLSKLDPSKRLFNSKKNAHQLDRRIGIMFERFSRFPTASPNKKPLLNSLGKMFSDLMASPHFGPRLLLSPNVVREISRIDEMQPLLFEAASLAIQQYGVDDPGIHLWTAVIKSMRDRASVEMLAQLANVLNEQLLAISKNPQSFSQKSAYNHGDLIRYMNLDKKAASNLKELTRITVGRYRPVLRGDDGDRPASAVLDLLLIPQNLNLPLDDTGRAALAAIRNATADRAEEFEQLLTEATRKASDEADQTGDSAQSLPRQFILEFAREDKSLVQVYSDWGQQSRELGIGGEGGVGGLGGLGGGGPEVVRERLFTVNAEVAMSTLLHEQTTNMLGLERDKK